MSLLLLIFAFVELFDRPRIARITSGSFPNVPTHKFLEWKRLELLKHDITIWFGFGWIGVEVIIIFTLGVYFYIFAWLGLPALLVAFTWSDILGKKADEIKEQYDWTDKPANTEKPEADVCLACGCEMKNTDEICPSCGWSYEAEKGSSSLEKDSDIS